MCAVATVNPSTLPLLLAALALTISIFFEGKLTSEALPIIRQERSVDEGPLHGSDFLSVFLDSSKKTTIPTSTERRFPRSTLHLTPYSERKIRPTVGNLFKINRNGRITSENKMSDGIVLAVRVSASVGKTLINKNERMNLDQAKNDIEETSTTTSSQWSSTDQSTTTEYPIGDKNYLNADQIPVASEDHPSLIAEANKNEFSIEEREPITTSDVDPATSYETPSRLPDFNPPPELLHGQTHTKTHPYQQTVIFHNANEDENPGARSVSYSTVTHHNDRTWEGEKPKTHERQERHYDSSKTLNEYANADDQRASDTFGTAEQRPAGAFRASDQRTAGAFRSDQRTSGTFGATERAKFDERNWESPERTSPRPTYAEQNYEVDESVSVVTNGRTHGVQAKGGGVKEDKKDDSQKVGYVVEGRNYRKYRVEERTPDGFIVGEYGVVSHDDGSLRGVRYTADGTINPRLIYDALMKFLSL